MNPFSSALMAWQYATNSFAKESKSYRRNQQWKSFFLILLNPNIADKWFKFLQTPDYLFITTYRKRLYLKPFRVYLSTKWNKSRRIKVIQDTYRFIFSKSNLFKEVIVKDIEITRFALNETMNAYLKLGYEERYRKEGEFVLSFCCDQLNGQIVSVSFSFEEIEKNDWVCWIGCVQGHEINEDTNYSKIVQKQLFGMRPKSFVVIMLQEFCNQLGIVKIFGASDSIQAYRQKHAIHLPWVHTIYFNYSHFWEECGGVISAEGWYELPLVPIRRSIYDLKTSKRALYTRRYKMLDELTMKIDESVKNLL